MPGEDAPEHRHTQHAFRFVVEGEGVWTVVSGDPVPMRRGDFLPQAGWNWHAHHNAASRPMAWIDGLDIPFQYYTESPVLRVRAGRDQPGREDDARPVPFRTAVGPSRACARSPSRTPRRARRCSPTAGRTPTAHWATSWRLRTRASRRHCRARATPPSGSPTPATAETSCRRSAPRCTASAAGRRPLRAGRSVPRSSRSSTAPAR